ncbi:MAG: CvpA family protein [Syntrophobacteraceae bacterium]
MNVLDWILIGIGAFWVLRGFLRGAVSQVFGIAGILAGFLVASYQYYTVSFFLAKKLPSLAPFARPLSFMLLFVLTWFCIAVVGFWVVKILRGVGLGFLDRLWGAMIGFGKALLFAIVVVSILTLFSFGADSSLVSKSRLAPSVMRASQLLFELVPANVQSELAGRRQYLKKVVSERTSGLLEPFAGPRPDSKDKSGTNKH